ncbi:Ubiquitin carboxyl-terminal hydrolase 36 [Gaertneriomyces sp. JEL0708]|nr:Ubiquitin carboxyl-terminal hydrolase 36 [Gaertneriomyces sp. JEL0708]
MAEIQSRIGSSLSQGPSLLAIMKRKIPFVEARSQSSLTPRIRTNTVTPIITDQLPNLKPNPVTKTEQKKTKPKHTESPTTKIPKPEEPKTIVFDDRRLRASWGSNIAQVQPGLRNDSLFCWLNSVVHALTFIAPFANLMLDKHHSSLCHVPAGKCPCCSVEKLTTGILMKQRNVREDGIILRQTRAISKQFNPHTMHDAHECVRELLERFSEAELAKYKGLDFASKNTTSIGRIFSGQKLTEVKGACGHRTYSHQLFSDLFINLEGSNHQEHSVPSGIKRGMDKDQISGWQCAECKRTCNAVKQEKIYQAPLVLTTVINRFAYNPRLGRTAKISKPVAVPETMNLSPDITADQIPVAYNLVAAICHEGSGPARGHYTCYARGPNGAWLSLDDTSVYQTNFKKMRQSGLEKEAYVLFYQRQDVASSTPKPDLRRSMEAKTGEDIGAPVRRQSAGPPSPLVQMKQKLRASWELITGTVTPRETTPEPVIPQTAQSTSKTDPTDSLPTPQVSPVGVAKRRLSVDPKPEPKRIKGMTGSNAMPVAPRERLSIPQGSSEQDLHLGVATWEGIDTHVISVKRAGMIKLLNKRRRAAKDDIEYDKGHVKKAKVKKDYTKDQKKDLFKIFANTASHRVAATDN